MKNNLLSRSAALFVALGSTVAAGTAHATLALYDAAIAADNAGGLPYTAVLTETITVDGVTGVPFDFGNVSGSATVEFILSGDPVGGDRDGFLAVGANGTWNFRYEQWDDTGQMGFTHLGVADYLFTPAISSPEVPTHVAYRYTAESSTMELFVNGDLAGTATAAGYEMPTGAGFLGAKNADGAEGMLGTINRVTVYDTIVDASVIKSHSDAFGGVIPEPTTALLASLGMLAMACRRRR